MDILEICALVPSPSAVEPKSTQLLAALLPNSISCSPVATLPTSMFLAEPAILRPLVPPIFEAYRSWEPSKVEDIKNSKVPASIEVLISAVLLTPGPPPFTSMSCSNLTSSVNLPLPLTTRVLSNCVAPVLSSDTLIPTLLVWAFIRKIAELFGIWGV